jgi:hypothetical protein
VGAEAIEPRYVMDAVALKQFVPVDDVLEDLVI